MWCNLLQNDIYSRQAKYQSKQSTAFIRNMSVLVWGIFWIFLSIVYCKLTDYKSNLRHFIGTDQRKKNENEKKKCSSASWCFMSAVFFWNICFSPFLRHKYVVYYPWTSQVSLFSMLLFIWLLLFCFVFYFLRQGLELETIMDVWVLRSKGLWVLKLLSRKKIKNLKKDSS